jgi:hypothetical protein
MKACVSIVENIGEMFFLTPNVNGMTIFQITALTKFAWIVTKRKD